MFSWGTHWNKRTSRTVREFKIAFRGGRIRFLFRFE